MALENGVSLDLREVDPKGGAIMRQHFAFLVSDPTFDEILDRTRVLGQEHWAVPGLRRPGTASTGQVGRGSSCRTPTSTSSVRAPARTCRGADGGCPLAPWPAGAPAAGGRLVLP